MSSSIFIESNSVPKSATGTESLGSIDGVDVDTAGASTADANLVVVYGKNGINFDRKGLENLIEEKTLSSISVLRITSPTPSMENEEKEAAQLEEMFRRQLGSDEEESTLNSDRDDDSDVDELRRKIHATADEEDDQDTINDQDGKSINDGEIEEEHSSDDVKNKRLTRKSAKPASTNLKLQKCRRRGKKERPEIVGLTLEEFYAPKDAREMAKEILKMAGISTIKHTADYEFQLYVIKNDHCYTPFTSPAQMKAKLAADKVEAERQAAATVAARKILPQTVSAAPSGKQLFVKKKQFLLQSTQQAELSPDGLHKLQTQANENSKQDPLKTVPVPSRRCIKDPQKQNLDELIENEDELNESAFEDDGEDFESDYTLSEESAESDNDRDSDLDFDVNNRKKGGRKRKVKLLKKSKQRSPASAANVAVTKAQNKRRHQSQDDSTDADTPSVSQRKNVSATRIISGENSGVIRSSTKTAIQTSQIVHKVQVASSPKMQLSAAIAALPPIPKKTTLAPPLHPSVDVKLSSPSTQQNTTFAASVRRGPIVQVGCNTPTTTSRISHLQSSPQSVKEIIINKVVASPKGSFTDISALLSQTEQTVQAIPTTPTSSTRPQCQTPHSSKGFMQLGIDAAVKHQLPAQISIQTHQSSSELAAEHDKQLDLIDSIVQDQMQKAGMMEQQPASITQNIPELVKMLESTEKALESNKTPQMKDFATTSAVNATVDDIDISSAALLETHDDNDIPDDLLQHVVKLIEDDKTLQEAVDKQVFGDDISEAAIGIGQVTTANTTPPLLAPIFQQTSMAASNILQQHQPTAQVIAAPKSIIQMAISNVTLPPVVSSISRAPTTYTPKTVPLARNEPIQIVRGNGRVITLPPIEAPTTRAKRRAQAQPTQTAQNVSITNTTFNESSLDGSLQSNTSFTAVLADVSVPEKKLGDSATRRRTSKEGTTAAAAITSKLTTSTVKRSVARRSTTTKVSQTNVSKNEAEASESQEDDDDPNKLWCVCRQPHNNRFMICCDVCEDWFHGTCVNITKVMGLEMEQKGIDWICKSCKEKQEEKTQRKITDMLGNAKPPTKTQLTATKDDTVQNQVLQNQVFQPKTIIPGEIPHQKQIIEIKKIQSGQFISLKNLDQTKKPPVAVTVIGGQKKLFTTTPVANARAHTQTLATGPAKRVIVQNIIQEHRVLLPNKAATTNKVATHQQQIKFKRIPQSPTASSSTASAVVEEPPTMCIVCKKVARASSIYCSDECIRKHAQNALNAFTAKSTPEPSTMSPQSNTDDTKKKKAKGLFEDLLSMADRKPKAERVNVFERKTGRYVFGNFAPTTLTLKKWLQDNPTFEVVQPGSAQAIDIEKRQKQQRPMHSSSPTVGKNLVTTHPLFVTTAPIIHSPVKSTPSTPTPKLDGQVETLSFVHQKTIKQLVEQAKSSPTSTRPPTPKPLQKYPQHVSIRPDQKAADTKEDSKKATVKRQTSDSGNKKSQAESTLTPNTDSEPIRLNVRRTLKEQLLLRVNELKASNANAATASESKTAATLTNTDLTAIEVENFVNETEAEMYSYFNRDTGAKYKAKYRSLMFNIKDRKNHTLFTKICDKHIEPKQLVRMSPEELASQQLAQWRENEAKHQLEMIKKSELDLLSCSKNYVLKTHKGEEVIEDKTIDCVNLDMAIPVEDVVSVLNNSTANEVLEESTNSVPTSRKDYSYASYDSFDTSYHASSSLIVDKAAEQSKSKSFNKEKDRERDRSDREKQHKNKDRHRDKSRSRKRSRSHSRSRSRSKEKRHKNSHKDDRREREDRDREKDRGRVKEREHSKEDNTEKKNSDKKSVITTTHSQQSTVVGAIVPIKETKTREKSIPKATFSLIDQILESSKTVEEAANLVSEKEKETTRQPTPTPTPHAIATSSISTTTTTPSSAASYNTLPSVSKPFLVDITEEPSSTVSISTPPQDPYIRYTISNSLWGGNINMIDVASFQIVLQPVVGNSLNLGKLLPQELDVVGRIGPETVWDYISKIKKSPNKEIVMILLVPSNESESAAYTILYQYLDKRKRLGVIKTTSTQIKDFYVFPLGAGKRMPSILQSVEQNNDFYEDPARPDLLVGIVIRVIGKRSSAVANTAISTTATSSTAKFQRTRVTDAVDTFTPPGSPKRKKRIHSAVPKDDDIDIDAIIKAPIAAKINKPAVPTQSPPPLPSLQSTTADDADEPYSPGDSSDDEIMVPIKSSTIIDEQKASEDDLKRKMDDLNRQIAAQEKEIAGLLNVEPSRYTSTTSSTSTVLANISIPSNLSQILASIKSKPEHPTMPTQAPPPPSISSHMQVSSTTDADEEYNPEDAISSTSYATSVSVKRSTSPSRLAQLSEAELLSMVPDDMINQTSSNTSRLNEPKSRGEEPPPPGV